MRSGCLSPREVVGHPLGGGLGPYAGQLTAFDQKVPRAIRQPDHRVGLGGDAYQRLMPDELQVTAFGSGYDGAGGFNSAE